MLLSAGSLAGRSGGKPRPGKAARQARRRHADRSACRHRGRRIWVPAMALIALVGLAGPGLADQGFYLINQGTDAVRSVHVSPNYSSFWGDNRLGRPSLGAGQRAWVGVQGGGDDCFYDVRVESAAGVQHKYWSVNLCAPAELRFPPD